MGLLVIARVVDVMGGSVPDLLVRPERPEDVEAIRDVNRAAFLDHPFSRQTEHLIVDALRCAGALRLSLVAVSDGRVVGHVAFSPARVGDSAEGWVLLGPIAVLPQLQRRGIGSALVTAGLKRLREAGSSGCVLVGDARFYSRFGFQPLPGLAYEGVAAEHVLGLAFGDAEPTGRIVAHEAFEVEPEADAKRAPGSALDERGHRRRAPGEDRAEPR